MKRRGLRVVSYNTHSIISNVQWVGANENFDRKCSNYKFGAKINKDLSEDPVKYGGRVGGGSKMCNFATKSDQIAYAMRTKTLIMMTMMMVMMNF